MPCKMTRTAIPGCFVVEPRVWHDARGFFVEVFKRSDLVSMGVRDVFCQANHSCSCSGVLRGLHFQVPPHAQAKLVRALSGEIFDVAVDIRRGSPTYGTVVSEMLSAENKKMLFVPAGCAHGFCVISDSADVEYFCTAEYAPHAESGLAWNDPALAIEWPCSQPIVSDKDNTYSVLADIVSPFVYE